MKYLVLSTTYGWYRHEGEIPPETADLFCSLPCEARIVATVEGVVTPLPEDLIWLESRD